MFYCFRKRLTRIIILSLQYMHSCCLNVIFKRWSIRQIKSQAIPSQFYYCLKIFYEKRQISTRNCERFVLMFKIIEIQRNYSNNYCGYNANLCQTNPSSPIMTSSSSRSIISSIRTSFCQKYYSNNACKPG